ncbi:MAG: serine/threonine-protein phosphatase [Myxococcales bacterium]|nr:MAG: serine/threonine-protein phosphatase [Myxococcales bacterium]
MGEQRTPSVRVTTAGLTDVGLVREQNEDAFVTIDLDRNDRGASVGINQWDIAGRGVLLAVSDGLGGHNAGEVASAMTLEALVEALEQSHEDDGQAVIHAVEQASERVREAGHDPAHEGMAATLTMVLLQPGAVYVAEVGDSRAYLLRRGQFCQVTRDQSFVQLMVDQGLLTQAQAERSSQRNVVLQVMGQARGLRVALGKLALRQGDRLVLCSDGLSNELSAEEICRLGSDEGGVDHACRALLQAALERGARDNVTVVVAQVDGALPPDRRSEAPCESLEVLQEFTPADRGR